MRALRHQWCGVTSSEGVITNLLINRSKVGQNVLLHYRGQSLPDVDGTNRHELSQSSANSRISRTEATVSRVETAGRGEARVVACSGMRKIRVWWYRTKAWPVSRGEWLRETSEKRRPNRGCVGSVTSMSGRGSSVGFLNRVDSCRIVQARRGQGITDKDHLTEEPDDGKLSRPVLERGRGK